ncbi:peroxisomal catalase 1-like [Hyposmocoma kahamanoa]|uniref:peroxisomal catalase 1-like n=1 Tax=Hyposmocoma kahamanoa TaxID=1477025 RepID=UPI000E6D8847|nr:peroxisomal catalase 1-like [Hyposmocoma kahamanoa]
MHAISDLSKVLLDLAGTWVGWVKGSASRSYFEVTNDVSKYTKAEVFNGIGKRTRILHRFAVSSQERGGTDLARVLRTFAAKFFTNEGNLDILSLQIPVFFSKQPHDYHSSVHSIDYGIPDVFRKTSFLAIDTFELNNKEGEKDFARFNYRTEQGEAYLTSAEAAAIQATDFDYFIRDLRVYNAAEEKNYPSWRLEMDVMSYQTH